MFCREAGSVDSPAIVLQSGNGYEAGFVQPFWETMWVFHRGQTLETEAGLREALTLEAIRWQYLNGGAGETLAAPEMWEQDHALVDSL